MMSHDVTSCNPTQAHHADGGGLRWHEIMDASLIARWSGLCYLPRTELGAACRAEGLRLVAEYRDQFTSW